MEFGCKDSLEDFWVEEGRQKCRQKEHEWVFDVGGRIGDGDRAYCCAWEIVRLVLQMTFNLLNILKVDVEKLQIIFR